jgi:energy-coupling factor transport system permease protein
VDLFFYVERGSLVHRLHPVTKLILLGGICTIALLLHSPAPLLAVFCVTLLAIVAAGGLGNVRRVLVFLLLAGASALLLWTLVGRGPTPLFLWMSREGLLLGVVAALRIDSFILAGVLFLSTTRNEEIVQGLLRIGLPYPICFAFSTALRLAPTFIGTGLAVREAQRARGLDPDAGSLAARLKANIPLLVPTFLTTIRMTNHLAMSLEARGFGLKKQRTSLLETHVGFGDLFVLLLLTALLAGAALYP